MGQEDYEVVSETIGLAVRSEGNKIMSPLFEKGTRISSEGITEVKRGFRKLEDNQTTMSIDIYRGRKKLAENNILLSTATFEDLEPGINPEYKISFTLHKNGELIVDMTNLDTGEVVSNTTIEIEPE